ncbi:DUF6115 domain-containing protein [Spirochaeta cellobiosiphila]|uniref:DUF6115 domain-containing protein n=1 Tax=Spirochaeta cellobiosiphila TaxID=504483 RepID=UPI000422C10B|nr:hypothetical protein [Spirochaeta cellobiosiphila]
MKYFIITTIIIGIQVLGFLYIRYYIRKNLNPHNLLLEIRSEIDDIIKEINTITDRNIGILEDRIHKIKSLIAQADNLNKNLSPKKIPKQELVDFSKLVEKPILKQKADPIESVKDLGQTKIESHKEQVIKLYRQGFSPDVISSKVGITLGEVELIISIMGQGLL